MFWTWWCQPEVGGIYLVDVTSLPALIDLTFRARFCLMFDSEGTSSDRRDQF